MPAPQRDAGGGRRLLPRRAARRSEEPRAAGARLPRRCWPRATSRRRSGSPTRCSRLDKNDRIARLVLGVRALKQKKYHAARTQLTQSVRGPITDLAATLLTAWAAMRAGDAKAAIDAIDKLPAPTGTRMFKDLHAGLILDLAGNKKEAGKRFERAYKLDANRAARGRGLRRLAVAQRQQGRSAEGLQGVRRGSCRAIR